MPGFLSVYDDVLVILVVISVAAAQTADAAHAAKGIGFFSLPQMYPTTLRLKTGLSRNMTKILPKGSQKKKLGRSFSHRWGYTNKYMNGLTDSYFLLFSKFAVTTGPRLIGNSKNMRTLK